MQPIVVLPYEGPLKDLIEQLNVTVIILDHGVLRRKNLSPSGLVALTAQLIRAGRKLLKLIKEENIKLIYTNSNANVIGGIISRVSGVKHVWHIREIIENPKWFKYMLHYFINYTGDLIIGVSGPVLENMKPNVQENKLKLVYNGIDYQPFKEIHSDLKAEIGISQDTILIGMIARVHFWKGQTYFLDVAKQLADKYDHIHFVMVGDAFTGYEYLYDEIKSKIKVNGLEGKVTDLGYRIDIPNIMSGLDIFMLPSILPDPLPTTVLEAMAAGKPVVATNHGGAMEMVLDSETGYLVPWDNAPKAATAFEQLIEDENLRITMGNAGQQRVIKDFSIEAYIQNMGKVFEGVLGRKS
ncbi:glycosyltransferase family 4 protein [Echinicola marina]|nr:glycosyltransferase family 4 protein [Echinicola marina]